MSVSYTKVQREQAKKHGWPLITVSVPGLEFQGPVPPEERDELTCYLLAMFKRRRAALKNDGRETDGGQPCASR